MKIIKFIVEIAKKYPKECWSTLVLLLIQNIIQMGAVLSIAPLIDLISKPDLQGCSVITMRLLELLKRFNLPATIYSIMVIILCFAIFRAVANILVFRSVLNTKYALDKDMMLKTFESFLNTNWNFFISNGQAILGNTLVKEINKVGDSFGHIGMMLVTLFQVITYFALAFCISWKISSIMMLLSIAAFLPFSLLGRLTYKLGKINLETANKIYEIIQENLASIKIVFGFGEQKKSIRSLEKAVNAHVAATLKSQVVESGTPVAFQPIGMAIILFSIYLSQTIIKISLADLAIILFSFYSALPLVGIFATQKNSFLTFFPAYEQLNRLRSIAERSIQPSGEILFNHFSNKIILDRISFAYPNHEIILREMEIIIPKGKLIAFVGKSGAGKSTLVDLLLRFYEPSSGTILIDGIDLKELNVLTWRHKLGYVPQDPILFNTSIRENLRWSKDDATDNEILCACEMANANDFLDDLPKGLDTVVGDRGVRLSGGQRQRIALARAILRNPELLILDEATSSLDSHSERLIQEAIENISHETTVVVVAHRLSTVVNADNIYVIDNGRIVEKGTFKELCSQKGNFYELAKIQGMT